MALYILIGLLVVAATLLCAFLFPHARINHEWWLFGGFTAMLLYTFVEGYWHLRKASALWGVLSLWLLIHTAIYATLFRHIFVPGIAYAFTLPAEAMSVGYVIWKVLGVLPRPRRHRKSGRT